MTVANYSLLLLNPTIDRLDTVVAGAVFQSPRGWDVRTADSAKKMQAIDPSFPGARLVQTSQVVLEVAQRVHSLSALREGFGTARWGILVDRFVGSFIYSSERDYQTQVSAVLAESVNPPSFALANAAPITRRRNVVRRKLRDHFKSRGMWSRSDDDINRHRIVEQFSISEQHGVIADFALRNGEMHITETIDFEIQSMQGKRLEAQAKAFVLNQAVALFGAGTQRYVVAAGTARSDVKHSVDLLQDTANLYALESDDDMRAYISLMEAAASHRSLLP